MCACVRHVCTYMRVYAIRTPRDVKMASVSDAARALRFFCAEQKEERSRVGDGDRDAVGRRRCRRQRRRRGRERARSTSFGPASRISLRDTRQRMRFAARESRSERGRGPGARKATGPRAGICGARSPRDRKRAALALRRRREPSRRRERTGVDELTLLVKCGYRGTSYCAATTMRTMTMDLREVVFSVGKIGPTLSSGRLAAGIDYERDRPANRRRVNPPNSRPQQ